MNNTDYSITYKRKLSESYQVITFEKGKLKIHELEMLRRNQISGFLPMEFMLADGKGQFWYNITGLQSLDDLRKSGRFQEETLRNLVKGLEKVLKTTEQYTLREESIRLDEVFFSPDGSKVYFGYLPLKMGEEEPAKEKLMQLLDGLIKTADYRDNGYVTYLFSLYEALGRENAGIETLSEISMKPQTDCLQETPEVLPQNSLHQSAEKVLANLQGPTETMQYNQQKPVEPVQSCWQQSGESIREKVPLSERITGRIKEQVKNKYLDEVWAVKKKIRSYTRLKPEKWEEVTLIQPEEKREERRNTEYLGPEEESEGSLSGPADITYGSTRQAREPVGRIRFDDPEKESLPLTQSRYVVGKRKEYANLVVEDASVSRVHALIVREEDGYYLEDLNSLNGTFLNGTLLELKEKVRLKSRDEIGVGHSTLIFEET